MPGGIVAWVAVGLVAGCAGSAAIQSITDDPAGSLFAAGVAGAGPGADGAFAHGGARAQDLLVQIGFAGAVVMLAVAALLRRWCDRCSWRMLWFGAALLGGGAHSLVDRTQSDASDLRWFAPVDRRLVSVEGWVMDDPIGAPPRGVSFTLCAFDQPARMYDIELPGLPERILAGDPVRIRGWLTPEPAPRNPGAFHSLDWRLRRGIVGRVVAEDPALLVRLDPAWSGHAAMAPPFWSLARLRMVRALRACLIDQASPPVHDMIVAMTLGARGESMPEIRSLFSQTGLSHFIVISGFHLSVTVSAALVAARGLGARRRTCGGVMIGVSIAFLLLLEPHVSVMRAGLAGAVAGAALVLARPWSATAILSLVTIVMLVADPAVADSPAFQLSFGAVAALLQIAPALTHRLTHASDRVLLQLGRPRHRAMLHPEGLRRVAFARILLRPTAAAMAASIVATPITLMHFGHAAPWAVPASVLLAPLASLIAIVALPAALLGGIWPPLADPLGHLLAAAGACFLGAVERCAELPGAATRWPLQPGWWCGAMVALAFTTARASPRHPRVAVALLAAWLALGSRPIWPMPAIGPEIVAMDLGRARSTLVRAERGAVLIDAGANALDGGGARTILRALLALGVSRLDALVLTERSLRSLGGAEELLRCLRIDHLIVAEGLLHGGRHAAPARLLATADRLGVPWSIARPGDHIGVGAGRRSLRLELHALDERIIVRLDDEHAPESLHGAIELGIEASARVAQDSGVEGSAPIARAGAGAVRGARRWSRHAISGWSVDRFAGRGWTPMMLR